MSTDKVFILFSANGVFRQGMISEKTAIFMPIGHASVLHRSPLVISSAIIPLSATFSELGLSKKKKNFVCSLFIPHDELLVDPAERFTFKPTTRHAQNVSQLATVKSL